MVEGPAAWQIASAKRLLLDSGKLSAHVPEAGVGFTVATPTAEVIDLGTDFGVVVTDSSETRLAVIKGAVQVMVLGEPAAGPMPFATVAAARKRASLAPIRVSAGQAVSVSRGTSGASVAETVPFKTVWTDALARLSDPLVTASSPVIVHQITPAGAGANRLLRRRPWFRFRRGAAHLRDAAGRIRSLGRRHRFGIELHAATLVARRSRQQVPAGRHRNRRAGRGDSDRGSAG